MAETEQKTKLSFHTTNQHSKDGGGMPKVTEVEPQNYNL